MMRPANLPRSMFQTRKPPRAPRPIWKCAEEFKRWLRKLPCSCCGHISTEDNPIISAHVDHGGQGTRDAKGMSTKVADRFCIPLCDDCHKRQHNLGWESSEVELPTRDAVALSTAFWQQWPGRVGWLGELEAAGA